MHNSLPIAALGFRQSESSFRARNDNTKAAKKDNLEDENEANKATFTRTSKATTASTSVTKQGFNLKPALDFIFL